MRVGFVEWPEGLVGHGSEWEKIADTVTKARLDLLITNELPFGRWIAEAASFDRSSADDSVHAHLSGLTALQRLEVPVVLSSRPVYVGDRLVNEAFVSQAGAIQTVHAKQYFPQEPGWYEASWYRAGPQRFTVTDVADARIGVMLCTDAMFNEHARSYGRQGASVIAIPRAAGSATENWLAAGKMAAIVSGSYVISSNRSGKTSGGVVFGGSGFAFHPDGSLLSMTDPDHPLVIIEVDTAIAAHQKTLYPRYVAETAKHAHYGA